MQKKKARRDRIESTRSPPASQGTHCSPAGPSRTRLRFGQRKRREPLALRPKRGREIGAFFCSGKPKPRNGTLATAECHCFLGSENKERKAGVVSQQLKKRKDHGP